MINEVLDPHSGAILFKKDKESLTIERLEEKVKKLESDNTELFRRVGQLEEMIKGLL